MVPTNYQAWQLDPAAFPGGGPWEARLRFVCRFGLLAPSVHNTQPWQFRLAGQQLQVQLAPQRRLGAGDPTGREAWLSLGACIENLLLAGRHYGLHGTVRPSEPGAAIVVIDWSEGVARPDPELLDAMVRRRSNRLAYQSRAVSPAQLAQISQSYRHPDVRVVASAERSLIDKVAELTGRGIGLALSNPAFKRELAALLRPSWTRQTDGFVPRPGWLAALRELAAMRWLPMARHQATREQTTMRRSAGLVLVFSRGDTPPYWLEAGRAYQRCALEATRLGLATATTAAVVEAADYHTDIERHYHTTFRLQTVMRLGYSEATPPPAPRRPVDEVLIA